MIDKNIFLRQIEFEDKNRLSKIYDKIILCNKINNIVYTNEFYPPNVWKTIENMQSQFNIKIYSNGIFEYAERKMIAFSPNEVWEYPIDTICIKNKSDFMKFNHKDYMGSIMALGIKREKLGDLVLDGHRCYVAIQEDLTQYVMDNLREIGKCPCEIEKLDKYSDKLPSYSFQDQNIIISSKRIDCVVSALTNLSRTKVMELIRSKKVLLDYITVKDKDKNIKNNSIITIRRFGKFRFIEENGFTSSGRTKALFKKFN